MAPRALWPAAPLLGTPGLRLSRARSDDSRRPAYRSRGAAGEAAFLITASPGTEPPGGISEVPDSQASPSAFACQRTARPEDCAFAGRLPVGARRNTVTSEPVTRTHTRPILRIAASGVDGPVTRHMRKEGNGVRTYRSHQCDSSQRHGHLARTALDQGCRRTADRTCQRSRRCDSYQVTASQPPLQRGQEKKGNDQDDDDGLRGSRRSNTGSTLMHSGP